MELMTISEEIASVRKQALRNVLKFPGRRITLASARNYIHRPLESENLRAQLIIHIL